MTTLPGQPVGNKNVGQPYQAHLNSKDDLITSHTKTRAAFLELALEKNRQATPFVAQARVLKAAALSLTKPTELLTISGIQPALVAAAGISDKAAGHLEVAVKEQAVRDFIINFLDTAGEDWVEELVFRFLITRGDTVGGSMRNIGGAIAQRKLIRSIIATLLLANVSFEWRDAKTRKWLQGDQIDPNIEFRANGLSWKNAQGPRTLRYNYSPTIVGKNIDLCLLACTPKFFDSAVKEASLYVALGELKGGVDPAGADEYWKTARTALLRIREAFLKLNLAPASVFIGAAIVDSMANEIWKQLGDRTLTNAANLTDDNQLASVCRWLTEL
ncbi:MAG: AvaI/BsoBI family type II restriction endonuclease [Candidatus Competibacteraceae bacterium]